MSTLYPFNRRYYLNRSKGWNDSWRMYMYIREKFRLNCSNYIKRLSMSVHATEKVVLMFQNISQ